MCCNLLIIAITSILFIIVLLMLKDLWKHTRNLIDIEKEIEREMNKNGRI